MTNHSREYPQFPIPAVGAVIFEKDHLLLIRRGRPPAKGQWTLPGGVIELGESPKEALIREVLEECRLDVVVGELVELIDKVVKDEEGQIKYHYLILDYLAFCQSRLADRLPEIEAGSDVTDARWVLWSDLCNYELTSGLMPVIEKAEAQRHVRNAESYHKEKKGESL